jgi:hypothetical protein
MRFTKKSLLVLSLYIGLQSPLIAQVLEPNLLVGVKTADGGMSESTSASFVPGDWVYAFTRKLPPSLESRFKNQKVVFRFDILKEGNLLAQHRFEKVYNFSGTYLQFNLLPDPHSTDSLSFRWDWSGNLAKALSQLPKGKHNLEVQGFLISGEETLPIVVGNMTYNNENGNGKMAEYAALIEKNKGFDQTAQNKAFDKKNPISKKAVLVPIKVLNNCGTYRQVKHFSPFGDKVYGFGSGQIKALNVPDGNWLYRLEGGSNWKSFGPTIGTRDKNKTFKICR